MGPEFFAECSMVNLLYTDGFSHAVMSPNIARPLTLRTSPSDYATFNQIKSILVFSIRLLLEREKQEMVSLLSFHCWTGEDFVKNLQKLIKKFRPKFQMTRTSNDLFWIKILVEVNFWEQPGFTFPGIFCKGNPLNRSYWKFCRRCAMLGEYFRYHKTGVVHLKSKVFRDRENIFRSELYVNNIKMITLFGFTHFFNFVSFLLYPMEVKRLRCAMLGAFTVHIVTISMGLPNLYFKGSQIEFSKLCYISVNDGCFNLSKHCRPWWNAAWCDAAFHLRWSRSSLFAKVSPNTKGLSKPWNKLCFSLLDCINRRWINQLTRVWLAVNHNTSVTSDEFIRCSKCIARASKFMSFIRLWSVAKI